MRPHAQVDLVLKIWVMFLATGLKRGAAISKKLNHQTSSVSSVCSLFSFFASFFLLFLCWCYYPYTPRQCHLELLLLLLFFFLLFYLSELFC